MSTTGVTSETKGKYLYVWLDSPSSEINVFDRPTADGLVEILSHADPAKHKAVVFVSRKTGSYINGVGLMLASAIKSVDEAFELTAPVRAAYAAVKNCAVPTIAVVKGSCFGCGVEFVSHCTYRVAVECVETSFYMTEIPEYLFIPAFGGSQLLPPLVGIEKATDLVLWGERWNSDAAKRFGLVSDTLPLKEWEKELERRLPGLLAQYVKKIRPQSPTHDGFWSATEDRISTLSTRLQPLFREAFHLLKTGAASIGYNELSSRRELKKSAESVMAPESRQAQGFFFVRQSARLLSEKGRKEAEPAILNLIVPKSAEAWGTAFLSQPAESFHYAIHRHTRAGVKDFFLETRNSASFPFFIGRAPEGRLAGVSWPGYSNNARVVEIRNVSNEQARGDIAFAFHRMGFTTIVTRGDGKFFLERFWAATVRAMNDLLQARLSLEQVEAALNQFGFTIALTEWATRFGSAWKNEFPKRQWRKAGRNVTVPQENLVVPYVFMAHWMTLVFDCMEGNELGHPSFADVVARDLVGFPLMHQSLTRVSTRKYIRENLMANPAVLEALSPEIVSALRKRVDFAKVPLTSSAE